MAKKPDPIPPCFDDPAQAAERLKALFVDMVRRFPRGLRRGA